MQNKLLELQEARDQAEHARDSLWLDLCQIISDLNRDRVAYHHAMDAIRRFGYASRYAERAHARITQHLNTEI